jgi:membrane protease YdiL (CAAX protease family)
MGATVGWGLLVTAVFIFLQGLVVAGFVAVKAAQDPHAGMDSMIKGLGVNGFVIAVATFMTTPLCIGLIAVLIRRRKGPSIKSYLGLRAIAPRTMLLWLGTVTLFALISDLFTRLLGRPLIPDFMADAYATASYAPLFWVAIVVAAPLFEEVFFRGFLFEGFQHAQPGPQGAVLLTAFAWTILHVQYGVYELSTILILGILFGLARLKTRSIYPSLAMHSLFNLLAMVQLVAYEGSV